MKHSKILFSLTSLIMMLALVFSLCVPVGAVGEVSPVTPDASDFSYTKTQAGAVIRAYTGKSPKIIIPDEIDGAPVIRILKTFSGNSDIEYIKLPASLIAVAAGAFSLCDSLTYIDVAEGNEKYCSVDGVLYNKDKTTLCAFPCGLSGSFTVPQGVKTIGAYAFDHCYKLTSVYMFGSVTEIGQNAFSYCWNLSNISLSYNLQTLGKQALSHCNGIKTLHLPSSLKTIGDDALLGYLGSDNSKNYYFIDGIYCLGGSYSYEYVKYLGIPEGKYLKFEEGIDFKMGDIDGDGKLTLLDVDLVLRAATKTVELNNAQLAAANIDGKNGVTTADAQTLLMVVATKATL